MIGLIAVLWYGNVTLIASQVQWQILSNNNLFNPWTSSILDFSSVFELLLSCWEMTYMTDIYLFFQMSNLLFLKYDHISLSLINSVSVLSLNDALYASWRLLLFT